MSETTNHTIEKDASLDITELVGMLEGVTLSSDEARFQALTDRLSKPDYNR